MFPSLTRPARRMALLLAIFSAAGLVVQVAYLTAVPAEPLALTLWDAARSFTVLTHALAAISLAIVSRPLRGGVSEPWLAALTLAMILAAAAQHLVPSEGAAPTAPGGWAGYALTGALPLMVLIWWLAHAPKRRLDFADLPIFALWPSIYGAYVLARGAQDGVYPNPYLDPALHGSGPVALVMAGGLLVFLLGGVMMISIGQYANR